MEVKSCGTVKKQSHGKKVTYTCAHMSFHLISWVSYGISCFHQFSLVFMCFHLFSCAPTCFHVFALIFTCFHVFSWVFSSAFTYFHVLINIKFAIRYHRLRRPLPAVFGRFSSEICPLAIDCVFMCVFMYLHLFSRVFTLFSWYFTCVMCFHQFSLVFTCFHLFSLVFMCHHVLSCSCTYFHVLSRIFMSFHMFW